MEAGAINIPAGMLQTIYGIANESKREKHFLYDSKAVELAERLDAAFFGVDGSPTDNGLNDTEEDYPKGAGEDFPGDGKEALAEARTAVLGRGALARAILLDKMVSGYIKRHPDARVVNLGCGMDTRFYRVDNKSLRWYDVDLPRIIEARKWLLPEEERHFMIGSSALDEDWAEAVKGEGPVLILAERLTMYLDRQKLQRIFKTIRVHFSQAELYLEIASPYTVKNTYENVDGSSRQKYTWGARNGRELAALTTGFRAVKDVSLMEGLKKMYPSYYVLRFFPPMRRLSNKISVLRREST